MLLFDTHCHVNFDPMAGRLDAVISRARERGVVDILVPAYDIASWDSLVHLAGREGVHVAFGLHPWAAEQDLDTALLRRRLEEAEAVAVGEIGLDFKIGNVDRSRQIELLRDQLDIAVEADLPVLLHCRGAFEELAAIVESYDGRLRGVVHAFSRGPELARRFLGLGLHLGFGGAMTRPGAKRARHAAEVVPIDRIVLETDAPSIGLEGVEPLDVEPHHVRDVAEALARIRGVPVEEIAAATTANAKRLFGID